MNSLLELAKKAAESDREFADSVHAQVELVRSGHTQNDKPFFDLELVDGGGKARFKIWSETEAFAVCQRLKEGDCCELTGRFFVNAYGLGVNRPALRLLTDSEVDLLLAGSPETAKLNQVNWEYLLEVFSALQDLRLRKVAMLSLEGSERKWRRAAAARNYHHARRGGLLEHTSQMLRCAVAIAPLYPEVTADLLYCGILFHDVGKLWENDYPETGFVSKPHRTGELLGHITIGIEVVNRLWNQAKETEPALFADDVSPPSDVLRDHLLHLIASHHGTREFGSPVTPRTPEGWLLHHIDNLDAKIEMLRCTYAEKEQVVPGLYENRRPLEGLAAMPLSRYQRE